MEATRSTDNRDNLKDLPRKHGKSPENEAARVVVHPEESHASESAKQQQDDELGVETRNTEEEDIDMDEEDEGKPKSKAQKWKEKVAQRRQNKRERVAKQKAKKAAERSGDTTSASAAPGGGVGHESVLRREGVLVIPEQLQDHLEKLSDVKWRIRKGFVPNMRTDGIVYASDALMETLIDEYIHHGGFLPSIQQIANVAGLPGIVGASMGMPDIHSGYGFAIGNVAAMDMDDPDAVVSPGGVGFDINCGVRLLRTNLLESDLAPMKDKIAKGIWSQIPVGVGQGGFDITERDLDNIMNRGLEYLVSKNLAWPEDRLHCEEEGCLSMADAAKVSDRAKNRGLTQLGSLGSGNHYVEMQVIDEIYDEAAAAAMGLKSKGQVCIMIHSGSRGLGHQVCTDFLQQMDREMKSNRIKVNDRQLTSVPIRSPAGQNYLAAMAAAANFAFCNRSIMTYHTRNFFQQVLDRSARDLDMHLIYDVCHNIAKVEQHTVNGQEKTLLVHRKGATRAFAPNHPLVPEAYRETGQPVLIGGSMGSSSFVLVGTEKGMHETFGSTCHGAGRALSRSQSMRELNSKDVLASLRAKGITVHISSPKLAAEEAPESYKDVSEVVETCHKAGISKMVVRLRPIAVIKG
eukprot:GILJ01018830.1.p1 GENE.GILJ01018830.1~~GILJ01018830.1.p1  ORF type:complete len:631 (+),score=120.54 GILJ01018830.1:167-2059(+)